MKARNAMLMVGAGVTVLGTAMMMNSGMGNMGVKSAVKKAADKAIHEINKVM